MIRRLAATLAALALLGAGAAQAGEHKAAKGTTGSYLAFDTLTATVMHGDNTRGVMSVQAGLDVPDPRLLARATASEPLLRDAYVRLLTIYASGLAPGAPPSPDQIELQLQRATDRVLKQGGARVLLGTVLVN